MMPLVEPLQPFDKLRANGFVIILFAVSYIMCVARRAVHHQGTTIRDAAAIQSAKLKPRTF
jgi:hypothetical protein